VGLVEVKQWTAMPARQGVRGHLLTAAHCPVDPARRRSSPASAQVGGVAAGSGAAQPGATQLFIPA